MRLFPVVLLASLPLAVVPAQQPGPIKGTWGIEASSRPGGSLLRFRSPTSAWVAQASADYEHLSQASPAIPFSNGTEDLVNVGLRIGVRTYSSPGEHLRPFRTISALAEYQQAYGLHWWSWGAAADMGAAWFFSPHVSLGGAGELAVQYARRSTESSVGTIRQNQFGIAFNGFRLLGAVYF